MGVIVRDGVRVRGGLRAFERTEGERLWRPCYEAENVVLNQWYVDAFAQFMPEPPGGMSLLFGNLALGYQNAATFARTDVGLQKEWTTIFTALSVASGVVVGTTVLTIEPSPIQAVIGETITLGNTGTPQVLTLTVDLAIGATTVTVTGFTPNHSWPIGTPLIYVNVVNYVPQRLSAVIGTVDPTDPPLVTESFYLPAAANFKPIRFTEAALVYNTNRAFGSHVAFAYTKNGNTDLRIDYTLGREI